MNTLSNIIIRMPPLFSLVFENDLFFNCIIKEIQALHSSFGFYTEMQYQNNNNGAHLRANTKVFDRFC